MKLFYLTPLTFPSRYVNRLQVMKMSGAFTKQADFVLYIAESHLSDEELFREYNIQDQFSLKQVRKAKFPPRRIWQAWKFLPVVKNASPDVVWYVRDVLLADWLSFFNKRFRSRYFFELHTLSRFSKRRYHRVLSHARGIITTNEEKKKDIVEWFGVPAEHILVAPNGVDFDEFSVLKGRKKEIRGELGIEEHVLLVVYAGTDAKEYGTGILREAAKLVQGTVMIISGKSRNEALKYMAAADVLVAPYLGESEHFQKYMSPMKLREYMAMGRPMVVSDLPSIRAYLPTEDCAYFTAAGDSQDLVRKINDALEHREEANKRAKSAYDLAHNGGFSWDRRAERILEFMQKLS
ncbi:MAG: group 1 glycosyl transferase [Parcubacteria group bacterium Gr01-1014_29]|nr:MAG: group 1 glycosyl transferase [Parcubacteria group bacterium Gr01-1014_29]